MKSTIDMARKVDPVTALLLDKKHPQGMSHDVFVWFLEKFDNLVETAVTEKHITAIQNIERKGGWITREDAIEAIKGTT